MPMEMGQNGGGLTNSLHTGNPQAIEREQGERLARVVAMSQAGQRSLTQPELNIINQIRQERIKQARERDKWQKRTMAHKARVDALIDKLEAFRTGAQPAGRFARAASAPRIVGKSRRREIARHTALKSRSIRRLRR